MRLALVNEKRVSWRSNYGRIGREEKDERRQEGSRRVEEFHA